MEINEFVPKLNHVFALEKYTTLLSISHLLFQLRERKAKPGDGAIYKRVVKQRQQYREKHTRGASSKNSRHFGAKQLTTDTTEAPLHPSWAAKREQKALLSISSKTADNPAKRIVFNDE